MKKIGRGCSIAVVFLWCTVPLLSQWIRTGKPEGISPITYMYADNRVQMFGSPQLSYSAPTPFISVDDGGTWRKIPHLSVTSFFADDSAWYMGGISGSYGIIYFTKDSGATWQQFGNLADGGAARYFKKKGDRVIWGDGNMSYISVDGGVSWTRMYGPHNSDMQSAAITDDHIVVCDGLSLFYSYLYGDRQGYYVSMKSPAEVNRVIAIGNTLICSNNSSVFVSTNAGTTWRTLDAGLPVGTVKDLQQLDTTVSVYISDAVYYFDAVQNMWKLYAQVPQGMHTVKFNDSVMLATDTYRLVRSYDKGATWSGQLAGATNYAGQIYRKDSLLYFLENWRGFHVSLDNGVTWHQRNNGLIGIKTYNILGMFADYLYITCNTGIFRSDDNGISWTPLGAPGFISTYSNNGTSLLVVIPDGGVLTSKNYGNSWTDLTPKINPAIESQFRLAGGIIRDSMILLSYYRNFPPSHGFFKSTNLGNTWSKITVSSTLNKRMKLQLWNDSYYAIGQKEVLQSNDGGETWDTLVTIPLHNYTDGITDFYVDRNVAMYSAVINYKSQFMTSTDTGKTWISYQDNLDVNSRISNFIVYDKTVFAGTGGDGVWTRDISPLLHVDRPAEPAYTFSLAQNYPNPFNPVTTIKFTLPSPSFIQLTIYDMLGREVKSLISEEKAAGIHSVVWDATDFSSGIYFYRLQSEYHSESKKLVLLK